MPEPPSFREREQRSAEPIKGPPAPLPETIGESGAALIPVGAKVRYFGDYEILEEIARGGMGVVYKARQVSLNRPVALKMILTGQLASEADVQRFHREAEAAANLDHPNIVPVYEIGQHEGQHYFSMKLIEGSSLAPRATDFVEDPRAAVRLLVKVARAVHTAHLHGILHRDLKPSNILLDGRAEPYVGDFGLAKVVDGRGPGPNDATRTGAIVGTPSYMAPEQARSEKALTPAVDVYGLGAILYELLSGRPPFRAENQLATILLVLDREPERPRVLNPRVDRDLETICLKCLEKEPARRYHSALAIAEDLERWLTGHTIEARPTSPLRIAWKWAKRNSAQTALIVVLAAWYCSVHFTATSGWIEGAFYGGILLFALWRLALLCARALGRVPDTTLNWFMDWFLLADIAVATSILFFSGGDRTDRKSLAYAVFFTLLLWAPIIGWFRRRLRAGPLYLALRPSLFSWTVLLPCFAVIAAGLDRLIPILRQEGDLLINVCFLIERVSFMLSLFLGTLLGTEVRKQGCVTFFRFVPWEKIESYCWKLSSEDVLLLRLEVRGGVKVLQQAVDPRRKERVDQVLIKHVAPGGQDVTAVDGAMRVLDWRERQPKRVRDPALYLIAAGTLQVVLSIAAVAHFYATQRAKPPMYVLFAGSAAVGLIVIIAGYNMLRFQRYRFCRRICNLAIVPVALGILLGIPFGPAALGMAIGYFPAAIGSVLALLVLRKPEIKAGFAAEIE